MSEQTEQYGLEGTMVVDRVEHVSLSWREGIARLNEQSARLATLAAERAALVTERDELLEQLHVNHDLALCVCGHYRKDHDGKENECLVAEPCLGGNCTQFRRLTALAAVRVDPITKEQP